MNVYSDDHQSAVKFMLDQVIDIPNLLYIGGDLNVKNAKWNLSVTSHSIASQALMDLVDSFGLVRSLPVLSIPIHYLDSEGYANSVINLIFLGISVALVLHRIELDLRRPLDYALLLVDLPIIPEIIQIHKKVLKRDRKEENTFFSTVIAGLGRLSFSGLNSTASLDSLSSNIAKVITEA